MKHPFVVYREKHGLTQEQLGEKLGVSQGMVAHIENKRRAVTAEMAIDAEEKIGIDRTKLRPDLFVRARAA